MRIKVLALLIVVGAFYNSSVEAQDKPLKVVICAGQSNMLGKRCVVSDLPKELQETQKNLFFDGGNWLAIAPGKTEKKGFGPEISIAYELSKHFKEPVGIIKHSVGGTNLHKQWSPKSTKSLYKTLLKKVKAAQQSKNIEIISMVWMQGESDAKSKVMAESYQDNLALFIQAARKDFESEGMLFLSGRINAPTPKFGFTDEVRKAQENCKMANYGYIDCDTLEKVSDNLHYSAKGTVEMGQKFAQAIIKFMNEKENTP